MKKRTKFISMAIALVLVMGVMAVGIWAATQANAGITANVSWTAQAGVEFELEAWAVNNNSDGVNETSTPKSIEKIVVDKGTSNTNASGLGGDLSVGFYDVDAGTPSDDGVNNPSPIVFTYKIKNTGYTILKVTTTKSPVTQSESGTTASDHKPAVELNTSYEGDKITTSQTSSLTGTGYNVPVGGTLYYTVTLSIANAELNINSFDAGVTFNFGIANSSTEVYVSGVSQSTVSSATTIGDYVNNLENKKNYPGFYYDEALTVPVPLADHDIALGSGSVTLFTKTATLDKLTFTSNGDGTCSVVGNSPEGEVVIPLVSPAGDSVTSIGDWAFDSCSGLTSITIPNSVTSIGEWAFGICTSLTSITIPNSVTSIENNVFNSCRGLTSITIPDGVTSIGEGAFQGTGITSITIPGSVTSIGDWAFAYSGLTSITIPGSVTSIGDSAFAGCESLTSITIPDSVTSISSNSFEYCHSLTSITIGDGVTSIGNSAFSICSGLTSIYIPSSVTTISCSSSDNSPFYNCESTLKIYCGASSKPSGWGSYWNYYDDSNQLSVTWGVTREVYNSTYA